MLRHGRMLATSNKWHVVVLVVAVVEGREGRQRGTLAARAEDSRVKYRDKTAAGHIIPEVPHSQKSPIKGRW